LTHRTLSIGEAIQRGQAVISAASDTPRLDMQVLLSHITSQARAWILAHPEASLSPKQVDSLQRAFTQLKKGVPLPYVLGEWEFYSLGFRVNPAVLIPRPETEILVESALQWLHARPESRQVADIGTGSGCIAISLALHVPDLQVWATDLSEQALDIARVNSARHRVAERIAFIQANLLEPLDGNRARLPGQFDLIAANLPYIPSGTLEQLEVFGREPSLALDGGLDGMDLIRRCLAGATQWLRAGGVILMEIEASQGKTAIELAQAHFPMAATSLHPDFGGHDRLLQIQT
jgi:release factor glutamine methyltransferase